LAPRGEVVQAGAILVNPVDGHLQQGPPAGNAFVEQFYIKIPIQRVALR